MHIILISEYKPVLLVRKKKKYISEFSPDERVLRSLGYQKHSTGLRQCFLGCWDTEEERQRHKGKLGGLQCQPPPGSVHIREQQQLAQLPCHTS